MILGQVHMARGKLKFTQKDVVRAVKAVKAAGVEIGRIDIAPDGTIMILPGKLTPVEERERNEWDEA